jgi:hypothetical protein
MVGGPNGSDPVANAVFEASFASFTETMGMTPSFMNAYVDQAKPIDSWVDNAGWTAWSWRMSPSAQNMIPVIGLPMATNADWGQQADVFRAFAAGAHDDVLRGIIQAWGAQGFTELYLRPGYEMNGSYMPWYMGDDPATQDAFLAAYRHIADVVHDVAGVDVKVVWNPNVQNWNTTDIAAQYPGDSYVDVVGADLYSPMAPRDLYDWARDDGTVDQSFAEWSANPVNRTHFWSYPAASQWAPQDDGNGNSLSLLDLIDVAKAHGKAFAVTETGAGGSGSGGPMDDPAFPQWLATTLANAGVPVAFANIWDISPGDGDWRFSDPAADKPLAAAAWAKYFGVYAQGAALPVSLGSGPDTIVLHMSEDAYLGDAQFTVSVDGVQVGGILTAEQAHASGQVQNFTVHGSFGAGAHVVAVDFLNDAWAGDGSDRNLYVDGIDMGSLKLATAAGLYSGGSRSFTLDPTGPVTVGSGPDRIVLHMSEDRYAADAMFIVKVDGKQIGGNLTTAASHADHATQDFMLLGDFAAGSHQVAITFVNDAYGGDGADRNLYVDGIGFGTTDQAVNVGMYSNGTQIFNVAGDTAVTLGSGPDSIVLQISEDAWDGDAQFSIQLDGQQIGGTQTALASHAAGRMQSFTLHGSFAGAAHDLSVSFLNDAYGGAGADRNLYVDSVYYAGQTQPNVASLWSNGSASVTLAATAAGSALLASSTIATDALLGSITTS